MSKAQSGPLDTTLARGMDRKPATPIIRDAHSLLSRGIEALERERIDEAVGLLRQAVGLDARSFLGQLALGIAFTKALDIPAAQEALEIAVSLEPENFYVHLRTAELYHRIGVPGRVKEELRAALDFARTPEEKKMVRTLLALDQAREPRRAWRPDFRSLLRKGRPKE